MPRRSTSPDTKPSLKEDELDQKPDLPPQPSSPRKRGSRIDAASRAALATAVIQRGVAAALADIDLISAETGLTPQQIRSQLAANRQNLRRAMEASAGAF